VPWLISYQHFDDEHDREKLKARFYGFLLIKASRTSCFCMVVIPKIYARIRQNAID